MNSKTDSLAHAPEHALPDHTIWDRLGIVGSLLCVVHCAVTPLVIGYLSAAGLGVLGDEIVHRILAVFLICIALLAFVPGYRNHRNSLVIAVGVAGLGLLVSTGFVLEHFISSGLEIGLTITGSLLLVGAHTANWRLTSREDDCCAE